jgi:hypothetical protein
MKSKLTCAYVAISIILLCGQPSDDCSTILFLIYNIAIVMNLLNAIRLAKKHLDYDSTTTNGNGVPECNS